MLQGKSPDSLLWRNVETRRHRSTAASSLPIPRPFSTLSPFVPPPRRPHYRYLERRRHHGWRYESALLTGSRTEYIDWTTLCRMDRSPYLYSAAPVPSPPTLLNCHVQDAHDSLIIWLVPHIRSDLQASTILQHALLLRWVLGLWEMGEWEVGGLWGCAGMSNLFLVIDSYATCFIVTINTRDWSIGRLFCKTWRFI
jgi:hypothetical protein